MESNATTNAFLFEGKTDVTYNEVRVWKAVLYSLVEASQTYAEQLNHAAELLRVFSILRCSYERTGNDSRPAAGRMCRLLTKMRDFHREMLGDMLLVDVEEPFGDLLKTSNIGFGLFGQKATVLLQEHMTLERAADKARKSCGRQHKKTERLRTKLSKSLTAEEIENDKTYNAFKRKHDKLLATYNSCFSIEARQRDVLVEQTAAMKVEFLQKEQRKLNTMFTFINDVFGRMKKLIPQGINDVSDTDFEPEMADTTAMATEGWEARIRRYTFPIYRGTKERASQSIEHNVNLLGGRYSQSKEHIPCPDDSEIRNLKRAVSKTVKTQGSRPGDSGLRQRSQKDNIGWSFDETDCNTAQATDQDFHTADAKHLPQQHQDVFIDEAEKYLAARRNTLTKRVEPKHSIKEHDTGCNTCNRTENGENESCKHMEVSNTNRSAMPHTVITGRHKDILESPEYRVVKAISPDNMAAFSAPVLDMSIQADRLPLDVTASDPHHQGNTILHVSSPCLTTCLEHSSIHMSHETAMSPVGSSNNWDKCLVSDNMIHNIDVNVALMTNVAVYALTDRKKKASEEISLRTGMRLTQTRAADTTGMAYGYKTSRLGREKYGFYPADLVSLNDPTDSCPPD